MFLGWMRALSVRGISTIPNQSVGIARQNARAYPIGELTSVSRGLRAALTHFVQVVRKTTRSDDEHAAISQWTQGAAQPPRNRGVEVIRHRDLKRRNARIGKQMHHRHPGTVVQSALGIFGDAKPLSCQEPPRLGTYFGRARNRVFQAVQLRWKTAEVMNGLRLGGRHHPYAPALPMCRDDQYRTHVWKARCHRVKARSEQSRLERKGRSAMRYEHRGSSGHSSPPANSPLY